MHTRPLPQDLAALIHHVELSKAGWRDRALELLVLAALADREQGVSASTITNAVNSRIAAPLGTAQITRILDALESTDRIMRLGPDSFSLAAATRAEFEDLLEDAKARTTAVEADFDSKFGDLIQHTGVTWESFQTDLLVPLVSELGAKTYQILTGEQIEFAEASSYLGFLTKIPSSYQKAVADQIVQFLDPTSHTVRNYLLRLLNTAFLVQAVTLSEAAMTGLISRTQKRLKLRVFVDTNFLFSLIGLHENPERMTSVNALHDLIDKKSRVDVKLYMLPCTMEEAKNAIQAYQDRLAGFHFHRGIRMALKSGTSRLSGITLRYIQDALNADRPMSSQQYFKPYLENFITVARSKGVELYNAPLDDLRTDQEVIDDVMGRMEFEKKNRAEERRKSYELLLHDMMLWHFTKRNRPFGVESPLDAESWVATIDFGLLGFDAYKSRQDPTGPSVCVHPTVLLQILQLWVPSSEQLDAALMDSLRPMLPHVFDPESERITIRILGALSRFENAEGLGERTVTNILLSDAVRARVAVTKDIEDDIETIRSALAEQNRVLESERTRLRRTSEGLEGEVHDRNQVIAELKDTVGRLEEGRRRDKRRLEKEESSRREEEDLRRGVEVELEGVQIRSEYMECLIVGSVAAGGGGVVSWLLGRLLIGELGSHVVIVAILGVVLTLFSGATCTAMWMKWRTPRARERPTGKLIRRVALWLAIALGTVVITIVGEAVAADLLRAGR